MVANPETLHPSLWRAAQLARASGRTVDTGYPELSALLPGGGWPCGALVELLVEMNGIGELRLLAPAVAAVGRRPIVMLMPPCDPVAHGLRHIGLPLEKVLVVRPKTTSDALWSAEQILRAGTCGALLFWQKNIRLDSLRRLNLVARSCETLFVMLRPVDAALNASPAELRLTLHRAHTGATVSILKRRGSSVEGSLHLELRAPPVLSSPHGQSQRRGRVVERMDTVEV